MDDDVQPTTIQQLAYGVFPSLAMVAAMQLDLFSRLAEGATTLEQLAASLGADRERLVALVDLLVFSGLIEREGEALRNGAEAERYLVKGRPDYRGGMAPFYEGLWRAASTSVETIRDGAPASRIDFASLDEEGLLAFFERQYPSSLAGGKELGEQLDFAGFASMADLGGGTGGTSIGICLAHPALRSTIYDLPAVTRVAHRFIAEAGLQDRIDTVELDLVHGGRNGDHDLAVVRSVLQVLHRDEARAVLRNAHDLLRPGGELIVVGSVLLDSRSGPMSALARGLIFMNVYDHGQSYTRSEHFAWLEEAGFQEPSIDFGALRDGTSVIRARRD